MNDLGQVISLSETSFIHIAVYFLRLMYIISCFPRDNLGIKFDTYVFNSLKNSLSKTGQMKENKTKHPVGLQQWYTLPG